MKNKMKMPLQIGSKGRSRWKITTWKIQTTCDQTELIYKEHIQQVFAINNRGRPVRNCVYIGSSLSDEFGRRLSPTKQTPTQGKVSRGQPHRDEETNIDKGSKRYKQCHAVCAAIPEHPKIYTVMQNINTSSPQTNMQEQELDPC